MYGYIYDVFWSQKPYEKELIRIENSLTDLGFNGSIVKLSLINNVGHAVQDLLKKGVSTIVAIGGDQLFSKIADQVDIFKDTTLGLIPLGSHGQMAELFGIPKGEEACKTLAARLVQDVTLSQINSQYFIHSAIIQDPRVKIICHDKFIVGPTSPEAVVSIVNTNPTADEGLQQRSLSVIITPASQRGLFKKSETFPSTHIKSQRLFIKEPKGIPILVDGQKTINTPATLEVSDKKISVIMGRDRQV